MNAQCDKLATVVGRQFITLNVHLCVQHDGREAARRAGFQLRLAIKSNQIYFAINSVQYNNEFALHLAGQTGDNFALMSAHDN